MTHEREVTGVIRDETPEEAAEREARLRPSPTTAIAVERERREQARRAERAARWKDGVRREGLWAPMVTVEQRLAELPAFLEDLTRRQALAPRLAALEQDVIDEGLDRVWVRRILDLHRQLLMEPALVANAASARRLLDDIQRYGGFSPEPDPNGIVPASDAGLFREWRRQLGWHVAPLPEPSADHFAREVEQLEAAVLGAIKEAR
jgi:hypothetical protein